MSNVLTQSLIAAVSAFEVENQTLRSENQSLRYQFNALESENYDLRNQMTALISAQKQLAKPILCVDIAQKNKEKLAAKKKQYTLKNEVDCECGGKSSKTPSVKANHEKSKRHMDNVPNNHSESVANAFQKWKAVTKEDRKLNKQRDARNACKIQCACGGISYSKKRYSRTHEMSDRHKQYLVEDLNKYSDSIDDLV
jgi:hypothetical protein